LVPIAAVAGAAALRDRALLAPLAVSAMLVLGPFVGFGIGTAGLFTLEQEGDLTVASLNAGGGATINAGADVLMREWGADILLVQECRGLFRRSLEAIVGWHIHRRESLCAVSRFPVLDVVEMEREVLVQAGGSAQVLTYTFDLDGRPVRITNVHLESPRLGLELILQGRIGQGAAVLREKSFLREIELRRAEQWARELGPPALVIGDFNTPPESRHLQRIWSGWTDAFGAAGVGKGGTRLNGWIQPRIDYVMADRSWTIVSARAERPVGSDHLPVVARLRLKVD
jgi:endonuclease/exonuclease/phosphatase (EEP) superfamily protein YafD